MYKYQIGQRVRLVRRSRTSRDWWCLREYGGKVYEIGRLDEHFEGVPSYSVKEDGRLVFSIMEDMVDPEVVFKRGDMLIRIVGRDGSSMEVGINCFDYDQMTMDDLALYVFKQRVPVTGTKSLIDTPDGCLMTIGIADRDS